MKPVAKVRGIIHLTGSGNEVSHTVMKRINEINELWVFTWRREGWKPNDWKLTSIKNKALDGETWGE